MSTSVIAIVVSLASWGASDGMIAAVAGVAAVLSFGASLVCFRRQADDGSPVFARDVNAVLGDLPVERRPAHT